MASLIAQDTSGVFVQGPQEIEVPALRTRSFRKFRLPDAPDGRRCWRIGGSTGAVHYRSDLDPFGAALFDEIDLTVQPNILAGDDRWRMERCGYQVRMFPAFNGLPYAAEYRRAGASVRMAPLGLFWRDALGNLTLIRKPIAGLREEASEGYGIWWRGAFGSGIAFGYDMSPDRFRKVVRIDKATDLGGQPVGATHLVIGMALNWKDAEPTTFASKIAVAEVSDVDLRGAVSERLNDPAKFPMLRADGREACWFHEPVAWDSAEERKTWLLKWWLERRGDQLVLFVGLPVEALAKATWPVYIDTVMSEEQVGAGTDDGRTRDTSWPGNGATHSTALAFTTGTIGETATVFYIWGSRFTTVPIPNSATINSASISFCADQNETRDTTLIIGCEQADNPATYDTDAHEPGDAYSLATSGTTWAIGTAAWSAGTFYASGDIAAEVQTIVNRAGWASNNALSIITWNPNVTLADKYRSIRTQEYSGNASGVKFNCTYTEATTTLYGAADLAAEAVQAAAGARRTFGASDLSADVALTADGIRRTFGAADVEADVALAIDGIRRTFSAADLSADVTLGAEGIRKAFSAADLAAAVELVAAGLRRTFSAADLAGAVELLAAGQRRGMGAAQLIANISMLAESHRIAHGSSALAVQVILSAAAAAQAITSPKQLRRPCRSIQTLRRLIANTDL